MKYSNITYRLAAAVTASALMCESVDAYASGFNAIAQKIEGSTNALPKLISLLGYIGGAGLGVAGIFKIKQHVDNPAQTPLKDGLIRLATGGALFALPAISGAMQETISTTQSINTGSMTFAAPTFTP
jgi:hypothetical protein